MREIEGKREKERVAARGPEVGERWPGWKEKEKPAIVRPVAHPVAPFPCFAVARLPLAVSISRLAPLFAPLAALAAGHQCSASTLHADKHRKRSRLHHRF